MTRPEHRTLQWWLWEHIWISSTLIFAPRDWPRSELISLHSADPHVVPEPLATRTSPGSTCSKRMCSLVRTGQEKSPMINRLSWNCLPVCMLCVFTVKCPVRPWRVWMDWKSWSTRWLHPWRKTAVQYLAISCWVGWWVRTDYCCKCVLYVVNGLDKSGKRLGHR